jgi:hypothetical protein
MRKIYSPSEIMPLYEQWCADNSSVEVLKHGKPLEDVVHLEPELIGDEGISFQAYILSRDWSTGHRIYSPILNFGFNREVTLIPSVELRHKTSNTDMYEWFLNRQVEASESKKLKTVNHVFHELRFVYTDPSSHLAHIVLDGVTFNNTVKVHRMWMHMHGTYGRLLRIEAFEYGPSQRRLFDILAPYCAVVTVPGQWCARFRPGDPRDFSWKKSCEITVAALSKRTGHDVECCLI